MRIRTQTNIIATLLVIAVSVLPFPVSASADTLSILKSNVLPSNKEFIGNTTDETNILQALLFGEGLAFPIIQQPRGNLTFVSPLQRNITEFQAAAQFGTIGLLAHNYLAGQYFFQITPGQEITLIYSDSIQRYRVTEIQQYQALVPESPISDFIDLATGEYLTASQLFRKTYGGPSGRLILQTCIASDQNPSWGRLFIVAQPVKSSPMFE